MIYDDLLARISIDPQVCGGNPCIKGTRVYVATILDGLAEGLTLTLHKICGLYFSFFMLPFEVHQGNAADLVEPHDLRSS